MVSGFPVLTGGGRAQRRGAVTIMVALLLTVLLGFGAFAIDLTQIMAHRSELQRAADAAVLAAVRQLTSTRPDSADEIARAYSSANLVMGDSATVVTVEYGNWNDSTSTFTPLPCSPSCGSDNFAADAFRVKLRSVSPSIFAQILGVYSSTVETEATAWTSHHVEIANCVKPFAIPYQVLTGTLNAYLGSSKSLQRPLDAADLTVLRSSALQRDPSFHFCLKEGEICSDPPIPGQPVGSFLVVDLNPGDGPGNVSSNIGPTCVSGPLDSGSVMPVESGDSDDLVSQVQMGAAQWCNQYGIFPCKMKVALWDASAVSSACVPEVTGTEQCVVYRIASVVLTRIRSSPSSNPALPPPQPRVVLEGYFTILVDEGMIGTNKPSTLTRPILVH